MIDKKKCNNELYVIGVTNDEFSDLVGMNVALDNVVMDTSINVSGMKRSRFELYVSHVFGSGFGWNNILIDIIKYTYTDYTKKESPSTNRKQYIKVIIKFLNSNKNRSNN